MFSVLFNRLGWAADDFGENRGLHGLLFSPVIMPVSSTLLRLGNESVQKVPTWWSKKKEYIGSLVFCFLMMSLSPTGQPLNRLGLMFDHYACLH
jgi:hypothetical protein